MGLHIELFLGGWKVDVFLSQHHCLMPVVIELIDHIQEAIEESFHRWRMLV